MSMAGNVVRVQEGPSASCDPCSAFLAVSAQQSAEYRTVIRGLTENLEPAAPERFVRAFLASAFDAAGPLAHHEALVARSLPSARSANGLALVAGSLLAIEAGLWDQARLLAERAYAKDQHETFAQRLLLAAQERSPTLRLDVDLWLADRFCNNPFTDAEIIGNKDLYTCCAAWMPAPAGSLAGGGRPETIWNGPRIAELRRSVLDGDFSYCSRMSCPKISGRTLPRRSSISDPSLRQIISERRTRQVPLPQRVLLSYDTSCNLSCPSCRSGLMQKSHAEVSQLDEFYRSSVAPLLDGARTIKITGSGDPFGSRHFRRVLRSLASVPADSVGGPRLQLHTNGVLFDLRAWQELSLEGHVRSVWVSVDATERETYVVLRRDGDFDRLWSNLAFLGKLRRQGQIGTLRLDFVVQVSNYRQMPALIDRASEIGADGVHFLMLRNWGTFTEQEFLDKAVARPAHPLHDDFLHVLSDPRFDRPGVDLGNLSPLRRKTAKAPRVPPIASMPLPPVLLVLGPPRSGSNLLFDMLEGCSEALVLREAFNPIGVYGADARIVAGFAEILGNQLIGPTDDRLVRHLRRHPVDSLLQLRRMAADRGSKALILKIFPDHISDRILQADILPDPNVRPLLLIRPPVEAWISLQKARAGWNWADADTTELKPRVDFQSFAAWQDRIEAWVSSVQNAVRASGRDTAVLLHQQLCDGFDQIHQHVRAVLDSAIPELGGCVLTQSNRKRQDRTADPFERIANGPEFRSWLASEGRLQRALGSHPDTCRED